MNKLNEAGARESEEMEADGPNNKAKSAGKGGAIEKRPKRTSLRGGTAEGRLRRMSLRGALVLTTVTASVTVVILVSMLSGWSQELRNFLIRPYLQDYQLAPGLSTQIVVGNPSGAAAFWVDHGDTVVLAVNALIIVAVILAQAYFFYRWKLKKPLDALNTASLKISENDLDFKVPVYEEDEMGRLCASFETMRQALEENFQTLWRSAEERKQLNAAFSHDLRTPLTVLRGYTELMETYIPEGKLPEEKLLETVRAMSAQVKRLERYTESMGTLQRLEDIPCRKQVMCLQSLADSLKETAEIVCESADRRLAFSVKQEPDRAEAYGVCGFTDKTDSADKAAMSDKTASADKSAMVGKTASEDKAAMADKTAVTADSEIAADSEIVAQVFENILSNAIRFSERQVRVELVLRSDGKEGPNRLELTVTDDGRGFGEEGLRRAAEPFYRGKEKEQRESRQDGVGAAGGTYGHFGLGLHICQILCQKHGGGLAVNNASEGGGCVTASFDVN